MGARGSIYYSNFLPTRKEGHILRMRLLACVHYFPLLLRCAWPDNRLEVTGNQSSSITGGYLDVIRVLIQLAARSTVNFELFSL